MPVYGYCRISTPQQNIERQVRNIAAAYPDDFAEIEYGRVLALFVNQQAEGGEVLFDEYGGYCCVTGEPEYKPFTHVLFINGYRKDSPRIEKEIESITIGKPKEGLCPDKWLDTEFFIIKFK